MLVNSIGWAKILNFIKSVRIDMDKSEIDVKKIISLIQKRFSM
jgi:hypothetical protein